jgi:signal peptidase I
VRRVGVAVVRGRSMEPTLHDGDRLLVVHGAAPTRGGLVVVRLPDGVVAVKRAARQEPQGWWVERDNPGEGVDSWLVGAIAERDVVARVLLRIWPLRRMSRPPHRGGAVGPL